MEEIWKDIEGFEGRYKISNLGNVKSLNYRNQGCSQNLVPKKNNQGYLWVELRRKGESKCCLIHRLVADAFIDNPDNYPIINHKDENPLNNTAYNLEWCTNSYNVLYSLRKSNGYKVRQTKHSKKKLLKITKDGNIEEISESIGEFCKENNLNEWSILQCCSEKRKTAYGCKWRFVD